MDTGNVVFSYLDGAVLSLRQATFLSAYSLLAWRYREVSIEIPMIFNNERVTEDFKASNKRSLKVLIAANIIISLIIGTITAVEDIDYWRSDKVPA